MRTSPKLYDVTTGALNQAVTRNTERFPDDFAFRLTAEEFEALKSQSVISNRGRGGRRRSAPRAFTEQGVAMLSSVLRSPRAVAVNVEIMRALVRLRRVLAHNEELAREVADLRREVGERFAEHDQRFRIVFEVLEQLMEDGAGEPKRIRGFRPGKG